MQKNCHGSCRKYRSNQSKAQLCAAGGFYRPARGKSRLVTVTGGFAPWECPRDVLRLQSGSKAQGAPAKNEMSGGCQSWPSLCHGQGHAVSINKFPLMPPCSCHSRGQRRADNWHKQRSLPRASCSPGLGALLWLTPDLHQPWCGTNLPNQAPVGLLGAGLLGWDSPGRGLAL